MTAAEKAKARREVTEVVDRLMEATRLGGGFLSYREIAIVHLVTLIEVADAKVDRP